MEKPKFRGQVSQLIVCGVEHLQIVSRGRQLAVQRRQLVRVYQQPLELIQVPGTSEKSTAVASGYRANIYIGDAWLYSMNRARFLAMPTTGGGEVRLLNLRL
jgi:hypothetical protein